MPHVGPARAAGRRRSASCSEIATFTVLSIGLLLILAQIGVNLGPLIASAGVIGVALGFGAQTMVKDFLSGVFLVLEDQFGVGDFVDLGPATGTVEEVTLRITRVRDMSGVVWYVRNGEILRVGNRSQGWTMATVDVPIAYNGTSTACAASSSAWGPEMDDDPQYDDTLFGTPTYAGVESERRRRLRAHHRQGRARQADGRRARPIRERLKLAFDDAGVRVPVLQRPTLPGTTPRRRSPDRLAPDRPVLAWRPVDCQQHGAVTPTPPAQVGCPGWPDGGGSSQFSPTTTRAASRSACGGGRHAGPVLVRPARLAALLGWSRSECSLWPSRRLARGRRRHPLARRLTLPTRGAQTALDRLCACACS